MYDLRKRSVAAFCGNAGSGANKLKASVAKQSLTLSAVTTSGNLHSNRTLRELLHILQQQAALINQYRLTGELISRLVSLQNQPNLCVLRRIELRVPAMAATAIIDCAVAAGVTAVQAGLTFARNE